MQILIMFSNLSQNQSVKVHFEGKLAINYQLLLISIFVSFVDTVNAANTLWRVSSESNAKLKSTLCTMAVSVQSAEIGQK